MTMRFILRYLSVVTASMLLSLTVLSAQTGRDGGTTLSNLLPELKQSYAEALGSDSLLVNNGARKEEVAEMIRKADEVAVMTYTQRPGFAIDMALALEDVSRVSESLREEARLSDKYLSSSRSGHLRYSLLGQTLREMYMPPVPADSLTVTDSLFVLEQPLEMDSEEKALLDSCLFYTDALTSLYARSVSQALQDSVSFAGTEQRLQQAYDYVQANYAAAQRNIFIGSNITIFQIFRNWDTYIAGVRNDLDQRFRPDSVAEGSQGRTVDIVAMNGKTILAYAALSLLALILAFLLASVITGLVMKYVRNESVRSFKPIISSILAILLFVLGILLVNNERGDPYWRTAYQLLSVFSWLTLAIFVSLLIRVKGSQARASRNLYIPTLLLAFMNILLRAMFTPASIVPLIFPPGLIVFMVWQSCANVRNRKQVLRTDLRYMWVSVIVMGIACILSLAGYSMIGVFLLTFWTFELALLHTITTIYFLMKRYNESRVLRSMSRYRAENPFLPLEEKEDFIEVTWIYDLLRMVVLPVTIIMSFPLGVRLTSSAYQLSLTGADFMNYTFFQEGKFEFLTVKNILIILALFFVFRFLIYFVRNMVRLIRLRNAIDKKRPSELPLKRSDVNTSLSDALFSLMGWLIYLIIIFSILNITADALKTILAGLAAGVGFALKDLINNFFYGVQLMAGRIKVGDKISCDGVRGIVKRVSYQTTTVEDEDGSLIAFTNTDLFSKKFRNLNSGKNYELLKMPVSVRYGTDVERAREIILEALKPLMVKDKSGRDIVDPSFPVDVRFDSFGDSSVNLIVALYSTVETHYTFPSRAKEAIYNAFHENGIEIPFPQRDVYVKTPPEDERDRVKM
jgi:small-conductance mechanosensitive channel